MYDPSDPESHDNSANQDSLERERMDALAALESDITARLEQQARNHADQVKALNAQHEAENAALRERLERHAENAQRPDPKEVRRRTLGAFAPVFVTETPRAHRGIRTAPEAPPAVKRKIRYGQG